MCRGRTVVIVAMVVAGRLLGATDAEAEKAFAERRKAPNFMRVVQWDLCVMGDYLAPPYNGEEDDATRAALARFAAKHDHVIAAGTWVKTVGSPAKFELNTVDVRCTSLEGCQIAECGVTQMSRGALMLGHPIVAHRPVERWDASEIVTVPEDSDCIRVVFRIGLATKTVTKEFLKKQPAPGIDCSYWQSDHVWTLVDGMKRQVADDNLRWKDFLRTKRPMCGPSPQD